MADKLNTGDIYTNAVGNNLVVVDPNKIVVNGVIKDRLVDQEDMVMYANLTATIYPIPSENGLEYEENQKIQIS